MRLYGNMARKGTVFDVRCRYRWQKLQNPLESGFVSPQYFGLPQVDESVRHRHSSFSCSPLLSHGGPADVG